MQKHNVQRVPIVDKTGKQTHVYKRVSYGDAVTERLLNGAPKTAVVEQEVDRFGPEQLSYEEAFNGFHDFVGNKTRWSKNERECRQNMWALINAHDDREKVHTAGAAIPPGDKTWDQLRGYFNGLHFAKEALSDDEAEMLRYAETIIAKIDAESPGGFARSA